MKNGADVTRIVRGICLKGGMEVLEVINYFEFIC